MRKIRRKKHLYNVPREVLYTKIVIKREFFLVRGIQYFFT